MGTQIKDLTQGKVLPNLLRLAFPLMGTSFLQMAYSLLAMAWVGRLPVEHGSFSNAIGPIGILMWLTFSITLLPMVGAEISVGQAIGRRRPDRAKIFASHATTLAFFLGIAWSLFYWIKAPFLLSFHELPQEIHDEAVYYLRIVAVVFPFQFLSFTCVGVFNGAGRSSIPFMNNALGLVLNIILDPFLMFALKFGGISWGLNMGFHGAAVGTVISQFFVFALFYYQMKIKQGIISKFSFFIKPKMLYIKRLLFLGTPVSLTSALFAVINFTIAGIAAKHDPINGVTSQTHGGQIEGVTWNTAQGFSTALSAFVAQNYAAKKIERGFQAYKYTIFILGCAGVMVSILFIFFGEQIFGVIVPRHDAVVAGAKYLFVMGTIQVFLMLEVTSQGMFNGVGRTIEPAIVNITFTAMRIPLAMLFASYEVGGSAIMGVWWAMATSTVCKGVFLPTWFFFIYRKLKRKQQLQIR